jgi:hypothetical protein
MWRRPALNPTLPLGVYPSEDGPESHAHSPRRRSLLINNSIPGFSGHPIPGVTQRQAGGGIMTAAQGPQGMPLVTRGGALSGSSLTDTFGEAAYFDWVNSLTSCPSTDTGLPTKSLWQTTSRVGRKYSSIDTSMPDYIPENHGQASACEPMHISMGSLEDEPMATNLHLKVPTNTPTSGDDSTIASSMFKSYV